MLSHKKGQSTNSEMKSPDQVPKKADQEGLANFSTLHLSRILYFKCFISSLKNARAFLPQNPLEGTQTFIKICVFRNLLHLLLPWALRRRRSNVSHVPCCGRCLQLVGRDPQKLFTFHFGNTLDFFSLWTIIFCVPSVDWLVFIWTLELLVRCLTTT